MCQSEERAWLRQKDHPERRTGESGCPEGCRSRVASGENQRNCTAMRRNATGYGSNDSESRSRHAEKAVGENQKKYRQYHDGDGAGNFYEVHKGTSGSIRAAERNTGD